jgi:O-antigen ligase
LALLFTFPSATIWIIWQHPALRRPISYAVLGLGGILLICGVVLVEPLAVRMQPLESAVERGSLVGRAELVQVAIGSIAARPISGVGAGNFPTAVILTGTGLPPDHAHNVPLQMATEVGVLGGSIWLWMWLSTGTRLWHYRHRVSPWAIASGHAWFAIGIISLFDGYFWALDAGRLLSILTLALLTQTLEE